MTPEQEKQMEESLDSYAPDGMLHYEDFYRAGYEKALASVEVDLNERIAQMTAHRACHSAEHDPANGRLHGYCIVCGIPWPCEYVGPAPYKASHE